MPSAVGPHRVFHFNRALVRRPAPSVVSGLRAVDTDSPNFERVEHEHAAYLRALEEAGVSVHVLPPLLAFPDSVFVEDTALTFSGAAILLRLRAPTRTGEVEAMVPAIQQHFDRVLYLEKGFVDGGDVLITPREVFIGQSARTTPEGAYALIALLDQIGLKGVAVTTPEGVLHLKSDCSLLDTETVLATSRLAASDIFKDLRIVHAPPGEDYAANAVRVNDRIFISNAYPRTAELLDKQGYKVISLQTREIAKLDAGLSCMSLRWHA